MFILGGISFLLGLLMVSVLTISLLLKKIKELVNENKKLKKKITAIKIKKIKDSGNYKKVVVGLRGRNFLGFESQLSKAEIKAEDVSSDIYVGQVLSLEN